MSLDPWRIRDRLMYLKNMWMVLSSLVKKGLRISSAQNKLWLINESTKIQLWACKMLICVIIRLRHEVQIRQEKIFQNSLSIQPYVVDLLMGLHHKAELNAYQYLLVTIYLSLQRLNTYSNWFQVIYIQGGRQKSTFKIFVNNF